MIVGYKLIRVSDGAVVREWGGAYGSCPGFPNPVILPNGDHVHGGTIDVEYGGHKVVAWEMGPSAVDVRDECMRRLVVLVGASDSESTAFRVANFTRRLVRLLCKGKLTDSERVEASAILAVDQQIEALHEASSRLEAAPPADYMADVHWTIPKGQGGTIAEGQDQLDISPLLAMFQEVTAATIVSNMSDIAARCSSPDETVANACRVVMDRDAARTGQTRDQRISYWLNAHASAVMATAEAVLARPA